MQQHRNRVFHDFRHGDCRNLVCSGMYTNISAKNSSRSDWGANPWPTATPLSQIAILKKNGSLDSGIQAWYLSTRHVANSGELLYTQCSCWFVGGVFGSIGREVCGWQKPQGMCCVNCFVPMMILWPVLLLNSMIDISFTLRNKTFCVILWFPTTGHLWLIWSINSPKYTSYNRGNSFHVMHINGEKSGPCNRPQFLKSAWLPYCVFGFG
jgi:hypothetical protein